MMRSLYSAISGLKNHQTRMDVIGNNIANVNTIGFKKSNVEFETMLSQSIKGASSPSATQGGANPSQVGLGMMLGAINQVMTQGSTQSTGKSTDLMLQGNGFFAVDNNGQTNYTRAGSFGFDKSGTLVDPISGARILGFTWGADSSAPPIFDSTSTQYGAIQFNLGDKMPIIPQLDGTEAGWDAATVAPFSYTDAALVGADTLTITGLTEQPLGTTPLGASDYTFDSGTGTLSFGTKPTGASPAALAYTPTMVLDSFSIDQNGVITGVYSNGTVSANRNIAQIGIASFANDAGLESIGGNYYRVSNNSGIAQVGAAGTTGRGLVIPGAIEMSNVDLSQEFTDMIVTQRGFQANSRVITVSDSLLQELIDLKRN